MPTKKHKRPEVDLQSLDLRTPEPSEQRAVPSNQRGFKPGLLPRQEIRKLVERGIVHVADPKGVWATPIEESQFQPASLDLRLGSRAYRVRASFLPGRGKTVQQQLDELSSHELSLVDGAVLERGCVYVVELLEHINGLPEIVAAVANPKSSTGRLDVFTRLITDHSEIFDNVVSGYSGPLFAEISPSTFSIKVRRGSRLNQIRFRQRNPSQSKYRDFKVPDKLLRAIHKETKLVDEEPKIRNGLNLHVDLAHSGPEGIIGYRAQRFTDVIDVDEVSTLQLTDYWEPIYGTEKKRLILDPNQFYILVSKEKLHVPSMLAAEMVPIDPMMGEFRVHYAGFFDPGFGLSEHGHEGSRAVLEVRSHEIPFILEDGQVVGRLAYEDMTNRPDVLYGQGGKSNYQGQGLKLSKHFRMNT
jgi:dCTP deaminase